MRGERFGLALAFCISVGILPGFFVLFFKIFFFRFSLLHFSWIFDFIDGVFFLSLWFSLLYSEVLSGEVREGFSGVRLLFSSDSHFSFSRGYGQSSFRSYFKIWLDLIGFRRELNSFIYSFPIFGGVDRGGWRGEGKADEEGILRNSPLQFDHASTILDNCCYQIKLGIRVYLYMDMDTSSYFFWIELPWLLWWCDSRRDSIV